MPETTVVLKGKDELTPVLQKVGRGLLAFGDKLGNTKPALETFADNIGALSTVAGLASMALPPVATTVAAVGHALARVTDIAGNASEAFENSIRDVAIAMSKGENVVKAYTDSWLESFKILMGFDGQAITLGSTLSMIGKWLSSGGTMLAAWGEKLFKASDIIGPFIKKVANLGGAADEFEAAMLNVPLRTGQWADALRKLTKPLQHVLFLLASKAADLGIFADDKAFLVLDKLNPSIKRVGASLQVLGHTLDETDDKGKAVRETFADLKKTINPHIADSIDRITKALSDLVDMGKKRVTKFLDGLKDGFSKLGNFVVRAYEEISFFAMGLGPALGRFTERFHEFIEGAAELEGVNSAFMRIAGEGAPALLKAMRQGSSGMVESIDLMKSYNNAALLISRTVAGELPRALEYLSKISLATGEDMAYLLDSLVRGVGRLSPKILDNLKIQTNLAEITAYSADMFEKQADALTIAERQAGAMALTLGKLEARTSGLADVTGSLAQEMAKYKVLTSENAKLLATHFLPVAKAFYSLLNKLATATHKNLSEGGKWYNTLRKISAIITVVIRGLESLVDKFAGSGSDAVDKFADKMFNAAWKALEWGVKITTNLAIGLAKGATTALIAAIQFISNILAYWMAPGSAPRFLPNLREWGAGVFTEYLRGFTQGDFGILQAVQNPLRAALQNLANLGEIADEEVGPTYISLSKEMAKALDHFRKTGEVSAEVLAKLAAVGGDYGKELEELFLRQLEVAAATDAVTDAENRLVEARNQEEKSGKALSKLAREYNKLVREGASQEALRAKMAEMRTEQQRLIDAREAASIAEDDLATAKERAKEAVRLAQLQADLLQQLIDMGRAREQPDGGGDDGTGDGGTDFPWDDPIADLIPSIDQSMDDMIALIQQKFRDLWASVVESFNTSGLGDLWAELVRKWNASTIKLWIDEFVIEAREDGLRSALDTLWQDKIAPTIQNWLDDKSPWLGRIWRAFTKDGLEDKTGKLDFKRGVRQTWLEVAGGIQAWLNSKVPWLGTIWAAFTGAGLEDGSGKVDFAAGFAQLWAILKLGITGLVVLVGNWFGGLIASVLTGVWTSKGESIGTAFITGVKEGISASILTEESPITTTLTDWAATFVTAIINGLGLGSIGERRKGSITGNAYFNAGSTIRSSLLSGIVDDHGDNFIGRIQALVTTARNTLISIKHHDWQGVGRVIKDGILQGLSGLGEQVRDIVNDAIGKAQRGLDRVVKAANVVIWALNNTFGTDIPYLGYVNINPISRVAAEGSSTAGRNAGAQQQLVIHNHFGPNSIRSDKDMLKMVELQKRALTLRGARGVV